MSLQGQAERKDVIMKTYMTSPGKQQNPKDGVVSYNPREMKLGG